MSSRIARRFAGAGSSAASTAELIGGSCNASSRLAAQCDRRPSVTWTAQPEGPQSTAVNLTAPVSHVYATPSALVPERVDLAVPTIFVRALFILPLKDSV